MTVTVTVTVTVTETEIETDSDRERSLHLRVSSVPSGLFSAAERIVMPSFFNSFQLRSNSLTQEDLELRRDENSWQLWSVMLVCLRLNDK